MKTSQLGTVFYQTPLLELVTWQGFTGWQGVKCHYCGATHNVFCGLPCIRCGRCGECITLSWFGNWEFTFRKPDYGWGKTVLNWATENFSRYKQTLIDTKKLIESWKIPVKTKRKRKGRR